MERRAHLTSFKKLQRFIICMKKKIIVIISVSKFMLYVLKRWVKFITYSQFFHPHIRIKQISALDEALLSFLPIWSRLKNGRNFRFHRVNFYFERIELLARLSWTKLIHISMSGNVGRVLLVWSDSKNVSALSMFCFGTV